MAKITARGSAPAQPSALHHHSGLDNIMHVRMAHVGTRLDKHALRTVERLTRALDPRDCDLGIFSKSQHRLEFRYRRRLLQRYATLSSLDSLCHTLTVPISKGCISST